MKLLKKALVLILSLVLLSSMLIGCGGQTTDDNGETGTTEESKKKKKKKDDDADQIVFWDMYWGNSEYESYARQLVDQYNQEHDGPDVVLEMRPWATYYQDYLTAVMSGSAPDVGAASGDNSILYGRMNELVDLSSIIEEWKADGFYDTFPAGSVELHNIDGKQYGIPWIVDMRLMYYNKEMFADAGVEVPSRGYFTFAELTKACEKLSAKGYVPIAMPGLDFMNSQALNYLLVAGNGNYGVNANFEADVTAPRNMEIFNWIHELVDKQYIAPESVGFSADQQIAMFASDECAMMISNMERVIDADKYGEKYGILTAPVWDESDPSRNIAYINPICVFSQTEYPEECKEFVKWWVENNGILFSKGEANFSVSSSVNESEEMMSNPRNKMIMDNVFKNITYYVYPCEHLYNGVVAIGGENHMGHLFTELLMNADSVDNIAQKYQAIVGQILAENPEQ